jgi:hypothetical protein
LLKLIKAKENDNNKPLQQQQHSKYTLIVDSSFEFLSQVQTKIETCQDVNLHRLLNDNGESLKIINKKYSFDFNEQKFLHENGAEFRSKIKYEKDLKRRRKLKKSLKTNKKMRKKEELNEENSGNESSDCSSSSSSDLSEKINNRQSFYDKLDLDNDVDLLDPSDSLDRIMLNLISKYTTKKNENHDEGSDSFSSTSSHKTKKPEQSQKIIDLDHDQHLRYRIFF